MQDGVAVSGRYYLRSDQYSGCRTFQCPLDARTAVIALRLLLHRVKYYRCRPVLLQASSSIPRVAFLHSSYQEAG
eukprot:13835859-Alexandrium_andersonii.AAC.1